MLSSYCILHRHYVLQDLAITRPAKHVGLVGMLLAHLLSIPYERQVFLVGIPLVLAMHLAAPVPCNCNIKFSFIKFFSN